MTDKYRDGAESLLSLLVEELAERLAPRLAHVTTPRESIATPWLTTPEAIDYTRLSESTFRKLTACGTIPSHGGRSKLFYRPELDDALLRFHGLATDERRLRQVG
jgi:hypothetical protein